MEQRQPCEHDCNPDPLAPEEASSSINTANESMSGNSARLEDPQTDKDETTNASENCDTQQHKNFKEGNENSVEAVLENEASGSNVKKARVVLQRLSSTTLDIQPLPKVNCTEKIIFCVDHSSSMFSTSFKKTVQSIKQTTIFYVLLGALKQFILTKSFINIKHEFSLFMLGEDAQLITDFNQQGAEVLYMLQDIANDTNSSNEESLQTKQPFNLTGLFELIERHVELPSPNQASKVPPPYTVRVILVYGRSNGELIFNKDNESYKKLSQNPYFFIDSVYIHEEPAESNDVTNTFTRLCELDARGFSYVLETCVDSSMSSLYNALARLLSHPLQRPPQVSDMNMEISYESE